MTDILEIMDNYRRDLLRIIENLTVEQLNTVPNGFNNNIVWNLGHILVVTDELLYKNTPFFSIPTYDFDIAGFKKGSRPEDIINEKDITSIRSAISNTVPQFRKLLSDYAMTSQKKEKELIENLSTDKNIHFILFHEDMHFSTIIRQLRLV